MTNRRLHLDFETASRADLKKVGASRYAADPSTKVLCVAWAFDDDPMVASKIGPTGRDLGELLHLLGRGLLCAWNASFELAILRHVYGITLDPDQVSCSMQKSLYGGFPASLEQAGPAMKLDPKFHKDANGHRLMMKMCKPKPGPFGDFWHDDVVHGPQMLVDLATYCRQDVIAERAASKLVPALPMGEAEVSALDRRTNELGVRLDPQLIHRMSKLAVEETRRLNLECKAVTHGVITSPGTQTAKLTQWFALKGWPLLDISKETIAEALEFSYDAETPADVTKVLSIRQRVAKSSVKKLSAMEACLEDDDCVRGTLQYYGAARTGRWAGRIIQLHNLPRPMIGLDADAVIDDILAGADVDHLRTFYGEPLEVIASCLRGCIIPRAGKVFHVFDFSQIEARMIAWLGGQTDVLEVFAKGADVYTYTADKSGFTGNRTAGKVMVLGLGYGMGWKHFIDFAKNYNLILGPEEAKEIVQNWRVANAEIVRFWYALDDAAKDLIRAGGGFCSVGIARIRLGVSPDINNTPLLTIQLPSNRSLFYRNVRLGRDPNGRDTIVYDGIDPYTKKWGAIRTWGAKLAENITQALARDIMAEAALRVDQNFTDTKLVLSVHDELVFEAETQMRMDQVHQLVTAPTSWSSGLPIAAEGKAMYRYRKI